MGRPIYRLDEVALGTAHPIDGGISGLHLRDEHGSLVNEFVDVRSMASETERLIFVPRESQVLVQRRSEGGRVNGSGERRGFPFFKRTLVATLAFIRTGKNFVQTGLHRRRVLGKTSVGRGPHSEDADRHHHDRKKPSTGGFHLRHDSDVPPSHDNTTELSVPNHALQ